MPFALEQVASSMAPLVLYGSVDEEKAMKVRQRFFGNRARCFVLKGGFAAYLENVMDPNTGEPFFGTVMEYDPNAIKPQPTTPKASMVHISSSPSLVDMEADAVASEAPDNAAEGNPNNASLPSIEDQVSKFTG